MYAVHKYEVTGRAVEMPQGARIVHVAEQHGQLQAWAIVNKDAKLVRRSLLVCGTGHDLPSGDPGKFVGTALCAEGAFVWHIFDQGESPL